MKTLLRYVKSFSEKILNFDINMFFFIQKLKDYSINFHGPGSGIAILKLPSPGIEEQKPDKTVFLLLSHSVTAGKIYCLRIYKRIFN